MAKAVKANKPGGGYEKARIPAARRDPKAVTERVTPRQAVARIGLWSSGLLTVLGVGYAGSLALLLTVFEKAPFTTVEAYAAAYQTPQESVYLLAQAMALLFALVFPVWVAAIHETVLPEKQIFTRIGLTFGLAFTTLAVATGYVQLVVVRQAILANHLDGLDWFLQWNPLSVLSALNMLAWFGFLGLAQLFIAPTLEGGRLATWARVLLIVSGIGELWGSLALALNQPGLVMPSLLLLAFGVPPATALTGILFRRLGEQT